MAAIKLQNSKVVLKNGKASCECCIDPESLTGPSVGCGGFSTSPCTGGTLIAYQTALAFANASSVTGTIDVSGTWNYISRRQGPNTEVSVVINESQSFSRNKASQCATGPNSFNLNPSSSTVTESYDDGNFTATTSMRLSAEVSLALREIGSPRNFCLTADYRFNVTAQSIVSIYGPDDSLGGIGSVNFSGVGVLSSGAVLVQYLGNADTFPVTGTTPSGSVSATLTAAVNTAPP
jgi:hypothetical protein